LEIFKELFLMMHPQGPEELNLVADLALAQFHQEKEKKQSDGQVPKPNIPTNPTNECPPQTTPDEKRAMANHKLTNVIKAEGPEQKFVAGLAAFLHEEKENINRALQKHRSGGKRPSALKHGAYSQTTVIGSEDPKQFEKLHRELIVAYAPVGPLEKQTVADLAKYIWRKQNLASNRKISFQLRVLRPSPTVYGRPTGDRLPAGPRGQLILKMAEAEDLMEAESIEGLKSELALEEHLDRMIDGCMKRLMQSKAYRSLR